MMTTKITTWRIEGKVTCQKICQGLAPSMRAASCKVLSTVCKAARK